MTASGEGSREGPVWLAQTLRLTAFPTIALEIEKLKWWLEVTGEQPETRTEQPKRGVLLEEGPLGKGRLAFELQPGRLNWQLASPQNAAPEGLESLEPAIGLFGPLMSRWLAVPNVPAINRLAFGAALSRPVENRQTGYRLLQQYLRDSVRLDPEASSDFSYQINRPRNSVTGVPGLVINRLMRWAVTVTLGGTVTMTPTSVGGVVGEERYACTLGLDVNTTQEFGKELPRDRLEAIFNELVAMGIEIATGGDFP